MADFNITLPKSWMEMTDRQLIQTYSLMARGLTFVELQTMLLVRWAGIRIESTPSEADGLYHISIKSDKVKSGDLSTIGRHPRLHLTITAEEMHSLVRSLDWIRQIPSRPVRPSRIPWRRARAPMLEGITFEQFIILDNRLQGWLRSDSHEHLSALVDILFPPGRWLRLRRRLIRKSPQSVDWLEVAAVQWLSSVKLALSRLYPNFLKPESSASSGSGPRLGHPSDTIMHRVDAQLRALTKGDITKEEAVRGMPYRRALAELDALARESDELRSRMKH